MTHVKEKQKNSTAVKKMFSVYAIGVLPLLFFLLCFMSNQHSPILNNLSVFSGRYPAILSSGNPVLSSVMSLYIKTAPLFGLIFFLSSYKDLKLHKATSTVNLFITMLVFSICYLSLLFIVLTSDVQLTEAGRLLELASRNDYFLTAFYVSIFYILYIFTCYYLSFIYALYKILRPT